MYKLLILSLAAAAILVTQVQCTKDVTPPSALSTDCPDTISFSQRIKPMFDLNCSTSGCHDVNTGSGGYTFDNFAEISASADISLKSMRADGVLLMPQGGPQLNDSLIQNFSCWKQQGKMNN